MPRKSGATKPTWTDPDDAPELTDAWFASADLAQGDRVVRRGRPPATAPKLSITLRLDQDIVDHFRASGAGWQTRINDALRKAAKIPVKAG